MERADKCAVEGDTTSLGNEPVEGALGCGASGTVFFVIAVVVILVGDGLLLFVVVTAFPVAVLGGGDGDTTAMPIVCGSNFCRIERTLNDLTCPRLLLLLSSSSSSSIRLLVFVLQRSFLFLFMLSFLLILMVVEDKDG